ncbi:hypothetical protein L1080_032985 [Rhodococcus sp. MSC1_016]|uniref:hypothetical protein n=1 Tax=Rhodococcus sp. MSC1_016 TaxID=2909266 RepID=UPI00202F880D|nr:hypothetical protein [Rhodococcus sp. MSC1_016]
MTSTDKGYGGHTREVLGLREAGHCRTGEVLLWQIWIAAADRSLTSLRGEADWLT